MSNPLEQAIWPNCSPATRPGASRPTSPNCCAGREQTIGEARQGRRGAFCGAAQLVRCIDQTCAGQMAPLSLPY